MKCSSMAMVFMTERGVQEWRQAYTIPKVHRVGLHMRAVTVRKLMYRARLRLPRHLRREPANNIGAYFAQGDEGLPKNLRRALYWYTLGAILGDFVAQCNLALLHYYGEGEVERNHWLAYKWFLRAA